jgi:hypothetical protein
LALPPRCWENSRCPLPGFDQDECTRLGDDASRDPAHALLFFQLLRASNLQWLRDSAQKHGSADGIHAERGSISVQDLARPMAAHARNHIEQIRKTLN